MPRYKIQRIDHGFALFVPDSEFSIVQLTDLHYDRVGLYDLVEMQIFANMCKYVKADLVINTGDFFGHRPARAAIRIGKAFDKIIGAGCPWAFAWGNHDCELMAFKRGISEFDRVEKAYSFFPHCLYQQTREKMENYGDAPLDFNPIEQLPPENYRSQLSQNEKFDGFYGGNYVIQLFQNDSAHLAWNIFVLNSRRWNHLPPKVMQWMKDIIQAEKKPIPVICFYHVPNYEYHLLWEQGKGHGIKGEAVCYEHDQGQIHQLLKQCGTIKAIFVGHDHVNDYWGDYEGIRYIYGRKSGIHAYGSRWNTPQKIKPGLKAIKIGGTLIKLGLNSSNPIDNKFEHHSIFPDRTIWKAI